MAFRPLTCFCSMRFGSETADATFRRVESVCMKVGFHCTRGARASEPWDEVRRIIEASIDQSFAVLVQASPLSWWVAFELFYSLGRKICLPLVPKGGEIFDSEGFPDVLTGFGHVVYGSWDPDRKLETDIEVALLAMLNGTQRLCGRVTAASLEGAPSKPPKVVVARLINEDERINTSKVLFSAWVTKGRDQVIRSAVIGAPGSGKTLLLAEFARHINSDRTFEPGHANLLSPLALFVPAMELPERDLIGFVRQRVEHYSEMPNDGHKSYPGLFDPLRHAGLVFLLVDGIDECFVRRRDEMPRITEEMKALASANIHLIVSCRENLWMQQFREGARFETHRILQFNQKDAVELLDGIQVPASATDSSGRIMDWLLNPLLLGFIQDLARSSKIPPSFTTRTSLYAQWASNSLAKDAKGVHGDTADSDTLLRFFSRVAIAMLQQRKQRISYLELDRIIRETFATALRRERVLYPEILRVRSPTEESDDAAEIEFVHESIYEFFVAWAVHTSFLMVIDPRITLDELRGLNLAHVELDYPQSVVYGFLDELLGRDFGANAVNRLSILGESVDCWRILRNVIEFLGMTHDGESGRDSDLVENLLRIAEDSRLMPRVRYNALRAIERIHPCAPRPYFKHVSDWGTLDYEALKEIARQDETTWPYVMRGHGKREPKAGRHWAWVENFGEHPDPSFERQVSARLGAILKGAIESPASEVAIGDGFRSALPINTSHAWIRWFDKSHTDLAKELSATAKQCGQDEVLENIEHFVLQKK
jgi:hypothetical protein